MKVLAIVNLKGGVGKTTTAINTAAILAERDKRVLLIDADSQYNLSMHMKAVIDGFTLCDLLTGKTKENCFLIQHTYLRNVNIIPSSIDLMELDLSALRSGMANHSAILDFCNNLRDANAYDFVIIDCPPSFSAACAAAICAADDVIIPTTVGAYEQEGVKNLLKQINGMKAINPDVNVAGVLITQFRKDELCIQGADYFRRHLSVKVFENMIWRSNGVGESAYANESCISWSPNCWAARTYRKFVDEYLEDMMVEELLEDMNNE